MAEDRILVTVKRVLGLAEDYTVFDPDVTMHINTALARLTQLGVGPEEGFMVEDGDEEWADFIDDPRLNGVKSFVYNKVRLLFDIVTLPGPVIASIEKEIEKSEWLLNVTGEELNPL